MDPILSHFKAPEIQTPPHPVEHTAAQQTAHPNNQNRTQGRTRSHISTITCVSKLSRANLPIHRSTTNPSPRIENPPSSHRHPYTMERRLRSPIRVSRSQPQTSPPRPILSYILSLLRSLCKSARHCKYFSLMCCYCMISID